ncbi:stationary phase inducible protein CsiE [Escherichia coli]|uniref:Stationary phase inducible protein CsiE n=1 Tax=Escherichia coli TaxID=562 RepID=A0A3S4KRH5_ECOLX|nr:stationary phase inducible protein CsiE [Escherichia coli]
MQENDLHEKQIILLTGNDSEREAQIEQQLRELTLLPLNIKTYVGKGIFADRRSARRGTDYCSLYHAVTALFTTADLYGPDADNTSTGADPQNTRISMREQLSGAKKHCRKRHQRHHPEHAVAQILIQETGENGHDGDTAAHRDGRVNRL